MLFFEKVGKAFQYNLSNRIISAVLTIITNIFVIRYLGIDNYGIYVLLISVFMFLEPLFNLQMERSLVRYIPEFLAKKEHGKCTSLISLTIKYKLLSFFILTPIIFSICFLFFYDFLLPCIIIIARSFFRIFHITFAAVLISFYENKYKFYIEFISNISRLFLTLLLLKEYNTVNMALIITTIPAVILSIFYYPKVRHVISSNPMEVGFKDKKRFFNMSSRAIMSRYINYIVHQKSEIYFLAGYGSNTLVAIYSLGYDLAFNLNSLIKGGAIGDLGLISGTEVYTKDKEKFVLFLKKMSFYTSLIMIPSAVFGLLVSDYFIPLIYGEDFSSASFVFKSMLILFAITGTTIHINTAIGVLEKWDLMILISGISAFVNIALNFLLIPEYGINGALVCVTIATLISPLFWIYYLTKELGNIYPFKSLIRILFSLTPSSIILLIFFHKYLDVTYYFGSFSESLFSRILLLLFSLLLWFLMLKPMKVISKSDKLYLSQLRLPFMDKILRFI